MSERRVAIAAIAFVIMLFVSCSDRSKAGAAIAGVWTSEPETLPGSDSLDINIIDSFEFILQSGKGGYVVISSMIAIADAGSGAVVSGHSVSASAIASIAGRFEVLPDGIINVDLDSNAYRFVIDPASIHIMQKGGSRMSRSQEMFLKDNYVRKYRDKVAPLVKVKLMSVTDIAELRIVGTMAECKIGSKDVTLRRQPSK